MSGIGGKHLVSGVINGGPIDGNAQLRARLTLLKIDDQYERNSAFRNAFDSATRAASNKGEGSPVALKAALAAIQNSAKLTDE